MILELPITEDVLQQAKLRHKEMPQLKNSITGNKGLLHGLVGEIIVANYLNADIIGDYDYDLLKNGIRLEVKTKVVTSPPLDHFEVSIANFNIKQQCDYYLFTRIMDDFSAGWFLGAMPKNVYLTRSRELKKGTIDGDNKYKVRADCWNFRIDELLDCDRDEFDIEI